MKSQFDFFEIRDVRETDEFAYYHNIGFIAPIKIRFKNDWKFCFAYSWVHIPSKEGSALARAYAANSTHLYVTVANK